MWPFQEYGTSSSKVFKATLTLRMQIWLLMESMSFGLARNVSELVTVAHSWCEKVAKLVLQ